MSAVLLRGWLAGRGAVQRFAPIVQRRSVQTQEHADIPFILTFKEIHDLPEYTKAALEVKVFDIKRLCNLSPDAISRLKDIVGPRYNKNTDTIKLTSDKYPLLAQNIKHVKEILSGVLEESMAIHRLTPAEIAAYKATDPFYAIKPTALQKRMEMYAAEPWDDFDADSEEFDQVIDLDGTPESAPVAADAKPEDRE
eukprot:c38866_g1_i1.p1 GENE.c38866_g1_i1~~c38866_g1_i1.p1  ORF type:complete len:205 (+),score=56.43 c38866_g1_i1:28-615(+)